MTSQLPELQRGVLQSPVATGVVKFSKTEKGWGAITSDALPGSTDAWVHYSAIEGTGYRELFAGDVVDFDFEAAEQDSFRYVATRVRRLSAGPAPTPRRRRDQVRMETHDSPDTPLALRREHRPR